MSRPFVEKREYLDHLLFWATARNSQVREEGATHRTPEKSVRILLGASSLVMERITRSLCDSSTLTVIELGLLRQ
jgi:hypothetical protein